MVGTAIRSPGRLASGLCDCADHDDSGVDFVRVRPEGEVRVDLEEPPVGLAIRHVCSTLSRNEAGRVGVAGIIDDNYCIPWGQESPSGSVSSSAGYPVDYVVVIGEVIKGPSVEARVALGLVAAADRFWSATCLGGIVTTTRQRNERGQPEGFCCLQQSGTRIQHYRPSCHADEFAVGPGQLAYG